MLGFDYLGSILPSSLTCVHVINALKIPDSFWIGT